MRKKYLLDSKNGSCLICHEINQSGEILDHKFNLFGADIIAEPAMAPLRKKNNNDAHTPADRNSFDEVLVKLEQKDSDRDGATNLEELVLGTMPGDNSSTPDPEFLRRYQNSVRRKVEPTEPPRIEIAPESQPRDPSRAPVSSLTQLLIIMVVMILGVWYILHRRHRRE